MWFSRNFSRKNFQIKEFKSFAWDIPWNTKSCAHSQNHPLPKYISFKGGLFAIKNDYVVKKIFLGLGPGPL